VGRLVDTLNPHAVQFLNLEDLSHIRKLKKEYPEMEIWQSIHLPEAGRNVDLDRFRKTVRDYVDAGADLLIFDTVAVLNGVTKFGGTGLVSDWHLVKQLIDQSGSRVPIWLAGGINPDNVTEAIRTVRPDGVDLCSGVEASPGTKDPDKVRQLIKRAKSTE
jgi:phosphoribosylanthranilate isomerase